MSGRASVDRAAVACLSVLLAVAAGCGTSSGESSIHGVVDDEELTVEERLRRSTTYPWIPAAVEGRVLDGGESFEVDGEMFTRHRFEVAAVVGTDTPLYEVGDVVMLARAGGHSGGYVVELEDGPEFGDGDHVVVWIQTGGTYYPETTADRLVVTQSGNVGWVRHGRLHWAGSSVPLEEARRLIDAQ